MTEREDNKALSKWKKAKRLSERHKDVLDTSKSLNKFITEKKIEKKLDVLEEVIDDLEQSFEEKKQERKIVPATEEELEKFRDEKEGNVENFKVGNKEYRFNIAENIMRDILKQLIKEKGKENFDPKEAVQRLNEYLGDKTLESVHFKFYKIQENDRLKYYQLLLRYAHFLIYEEKIVLDNQDFSNIWESIIQPIVDHGKIFELDETMIPILRDTDSTKTEMPFNQVLLDCRIPIDDRIYYGLVVGKFFTDNKNPPAVVRETESKGHYVYTGVLSCYSKIDQKDGERKMYLEFFDTENLFVDNKPLKKYQKKLMNFFYSFCNFINEPDVEVIDAPFNPKNNQRRAEKGSMPLPANKKIRIYGKLKQYVTSYNSGLSQGIGHRFSVRGHFRHFREEKRYVGLYKLSEEDLAKKGYQKSKGMVKKWIKPFIKGHGIMIDKTYKVVKGGQEKNE